MDPERKRLIRLFTTLGVAVLLAGALVWTSFSASSETRTPGELSRMAQAGQSYELTGRVVDGSVVRRGESISFAVRDRDGTTSVPVSYSGVVPDPFREGREVIVEVRKQDGVFVGRPDSLVTKCPSKFTNAEET